MPLKKKQRGGKRGGAASPPLPLSLSKGASVPVLPPKVQADFDGLAHGRVAREGRAPDPVGGHERVRVPPLLEQRLALVEQAVGGVARLLSLLLPGFLGGGGCFRFWGRCGADFGSFCVVFEEMWVRYE